MRACLGSGIGQHLQISASAQHLHHGRQQIFSVNEIQTLTNNAKLASKLGMAIWPMHWLSGETSIHNDVTGSHETHSSHVSLCTVFAQGCSQFDTLPLTLATAYQAICWCVSNLQCTVAEVVYMARKVF